MRRALRLLKLSQCGLSLNVCVFCRFVRCEKEIAVARCEASEEEALRHRQRVEHQDREMKELQEALNAEREKMQVRNRGMED